MALLKRKPAGLGRPRQAIQKIARSPDRRREFNRKVEDISKMSLGGSIAFLAMGKTLPAYAAGALSYLALRHSIRERKFCADRLIRACVARPNIANAVAEIYLRSGYAELADKIRELGHLGIGFFGTENFIERLAKDRKFRKASTEKMRAVATSQFRGEIIEEMARAKVDRAIVNMIRDAENRKN